MQAVTEEQILAALSAVQDPSQNKDIVALIRPWDIQSIDPVWKVF